MVQLIKLILVWVILVAITNKISFFINLWFKQTLQVIDHCRCFEVHQWLYSSWWNQDTESLPLDLWQSFGFPWIQLAFRGKEESKLFFPWELHISFGITVSLENYSKSPSRYMRGFHIWSQAGEYCLVTTLNYEKRSISFGEQLSHADLLTVEKQWPKSGPRTHLLRN